MSDSTIINILYVLKAQRQIWDKQGVSSLVV